MEGLRIEDGIQGVWQQIEDGVGFVVAGHNYGRLDRLSDEEIEGVGRYIADIACDANRLLEGISLVEYDRLADKIEQRRSEYPLQ